MNFQMEGIIKDIWIIPINNYIIRENVRDA